MASNGIVFRPGRGPSFILVGLVVIVIILFYSYWGVSSKNNKLLRDVSVLQDRLRVLAARKLTADKKGSALVSQITQMQDEKEKEINSKDSKISDMTKTLQTREAELTKFREQEKHYQAELEKLKRGVNSSSSDLRTLKGRADELLKKYKEMKESHSSLLQKVTNLTSERDVCQKELVKVKMELDQQKKIQDVKVVPSDRNVSDKTNDAKKVKAADEGQSIGEGSDEEKKESEKDDENTVSSKKEKEKESVEEKNPVPSRVSANQNNISKPGNASVLPNVPGNIKPEGNKSQNEETDKRNQDNPDNSEEVDRETGKDEENTEQPNEEESPEENKDMDSQPVTASDKNIRQEENEEEVDEEGEKEEEESDDDLDKGGRVERSTNLAADMRRRMLPLAGGSLEQMPRNAQPAGSMEEIRKLQKNSMDAPGMMPGRISPLDIPGRLEQVRRRKEAEDQDQ